MANTKASEQTIITSTLNADHINEKTTSHGITLPAGTSLNYGSTFMNRAQEAFGANGTTAIATSPGTNIASINIVAGTYLVIFNYRLKVIVDNAAFVMAYLHNGTSSISVGRLIFEGPTGVADYKNRGGSVSWLLRSSGSQTVTVRLRAGVANQWQMYNERFIDASTNGNGETGLLAIRLGTESIES